MKQPEGTRIADTRKLQEIMHCHGREEFLKLLTQAFFNASEEMEDLNMNESEEYRSLANELYDKTENK